MPDKVYNSGMKAKLSAVAAICVLIAAFLCCCVPEGEIPSGNGQEETPAEEENGEIREMKITINGIQFTATLESGAAAQAFARLLPLEISMNELNGNEKYCYLDEPLPQNAERVGRIEAGDIMLWGDDCIVVFYESFNTSYRYTRLGKVINAENLAHAAGAGTAQVTFGRE